MPEYVHLNQDLRIIEVLSIGEISLEDLNKSLASVLEFVNQCGSCSILVDTRKQTSLPRLRDYKSFLDQLPANIKIAILVCDRGKTRSLQHTGESFARSKSKNYKLFYDRDQAIAWL